MSASPDRRPLPRSESQAPGSAPETGAVLPPPVQEHLGKELRAAYQQATEKPAFLGDTSLPTAIEEKVEQLAERDALTRARARRVATEAVRTALDEVVSGSAKTEAPAARHPSSEE
jgi:hypothetical protein